MRRVMMIVAVIGLFAACKKDAKKTEGETPPAGSAAKPADPAVKTDTPTDPAADQAAKDPAATAVTPDKPAMGMPPAAGGARPPTVTDAHVALADKMMAAMESMGKSVAAAGKDCKAAGAALKTSAEAVKPLFEEVEKVKASMPDDKAAEEWFKANYMAKMMGAMAPMQQVAMACGQDKDFQAAMMSMGPMMGGGGKKKGP